MLYFVDFSNAIFSLYPNNYMACSEFKFRI